MRVLAVLLLLGLAPAARAEEWRTQDTVLQLTLTALMVVDLGQTGHLMQSGWELNPILGVDPNKSRMRLYFGGAIVGHALVSYVLPQPYRMIWQCTWIGVETHAVWRNYRVAGGLSLSW